MDVSQDQNLSVDREQYGSSSVESFGSATITEELDEEEHTLPQPEEIPERDEFLEAILRAATEPYQSASAMSRTEVPTPAQQALPPPSQKITIHLVRHAEGPHNLRSIPERDRVAMPDPGLTPYGIAQSKLLSQRFHAMDKITHIISSPLSRTLHTALIAFSPAIDRGIQVILFPDLRECGLGPCNTGSSIHELVEEMFRLEPGVRRNCIDAFNCYPGWEQPTESWYHAEGRHQRAEYMRSMLFHLGQIAASESSDDVEIVVVTHSRFIMALEKTADNRDAYFNAEYKSYQAVEDVDAVSGVERYTLVETEESKHYVHTIPEDVSLVD